MDVEVKYLQNCLLGLQRFSYSKGALILQLDRYLCNGIKILYSVILVLRHHYIICIRRTPISRPFEIRIKLTVL